MVYLCVNHILIYYQCLINQKLVIHIKMEQIFGINIPLNLALALFIVKPETLPEAAPIGPTKNF